MLGAYRAALDDEPILVVPTFADVDHYRRELAGAGAVFGVRVVRLLGPDARDRAPGRGRRADRSRGWRASASPAPRSPGSGWRRSRRRPRRRASSRLCCALVTELEEQRIEPGRWWAAMRAWGEREPRARRLRRGARARCTAPTATACARSSRRDRVLHDQAALDALRLEPARWGATPVFLYGFDDLTPLQRDAIETLAVHAGAPVTVSLTYEPGRAAFAGRGETFQELLALGPEHVELPAARRALRAPGAARARAHAVRAAARRASRSRRRAAAARGRRRARRDRARRRRTSRADRRGGLRARGHRGRPARAARARRAARRRSSASSSVPFALDAHDRRRAHRARPRARRAAALRAARRQRRRPARLAAHAGQARAARRSPTASSSAPASRGRRPPREARALWEADHPDFVAARARSRRRRARRRPGGAVPAPGRRVRRAVRRAASRPTRRCWPAPRRSTRASPARCARRWASSSAWRPSIARSCRRPTSSRASCTTSRCAPHDDRRPGLVAITSPRALRARRVRAVFLLRPARGRLPAPGHARAVPGRRRAPRAQRRVGPAPAPARGPPRTPSATCSTRSPPPDRAARAQLARGRRRGRAVRALAVRRRRRSTCFDPRAAERVRAPGARARPASRPRCAPTEHEAARQRLAARAGRRPSRRHRVAARRRAVLARASTSARPGRPRRSRPRPRAR